MNTLRAPSIPLLALGLLLVVIGLAGTCGSVAHANDGPLAVVVGNEIPAGIDPIAVRDTMRVCMSERDVSVQTMDCRTIMATITRRAGLTQRTYLEQLRAYSPEATGIRPSRNIRQQWVSTIEATCEQPAGWPAYNAWRVEHGVCFRMERGPDGRARIYRDEAGNPERIQCQPLPWAGERYEACVATFDEVVREMQEPSRVCGGQIPDHWGGRCDEEGLPARNPEGRRVGVCDRAPSAWVVLDCGETRNTFYRVPRVRRAPRADGARPGVLPARVARGD